MSRRIRVVKVRKDHVCEACGVTIKKGEKAFVESVLLTAYQRYPEVYYYHYKEGMSEDEFNKLSLDEIRKMICKNE
ncbi:MAG: hypothetical protein FHOMOCKG_00018 [Methanophagales virus GBV302]|uniref:Uncharacterized protein n=1 Tax=Methanophagales virus GBV302 TaxID=2999281 RepID=A0A9E8VDH2_9CAUD|nr:MAG: hypothetical protein QIT37_gp018 [Methanophagales virus GBV302]WAE39546.1 MAG: hypothetical protein FHOMOCKG_00018 [Methanophagales virus GBV302]